MKFLNLFLPFLFSCCFAINSFAQVTFEKINAENLTIGTVVNWTTHNEAENTLFILEKSMNGQQYFPIFERKAKERNAESTYSFLDIQTNKAITYYRIKQLAEDDTYSYSEILEVQPTFQNNLIVEYVTDLTNEKNEGMLSVQLSSSIASSLTYSIENEAQVIVKTGETTIQIGPNMLSINLVNLEKGVYYLKMKMGEETEIILLDKLDDQHNLEVSLNAKAQYSGQFKQE